MEFFSSYKDLLSAAAVIITIFAFIPYINSTYHGKVKPHIFTWIIWSITTLIVFFAQLSDKGGVGAWAMGVSACITIFIALLAYLKQSTLVIRRVDWIFLVLAIASLPLWYITSDPVTAVIILTTIDALGFLPTIRKSYVDPYSESVKFFLMITIRDIFILLALENYSITTVLFPSTVATLSIIVIAVTMYRRIMINHAIKLK